MIRTEALWISAFLAIGAIGGAVYNWPSSDEVLEENADTSSDVQSAISANQADDEATAEPEINLLRENPQPLAAAQPEDTELEPAPEAGIWNSISPPAKRKQPIDPNVMELGDGYLTGGNAMGAYDHYTKLWQRANLPMESSVLIRLGLASEMAGLLDQAEKHYRSAIRVSQRGSTQQLASLLGTARIWEQQGHLDDAIGLLGELFLLYTADDQPATIRQSIVKQLADCLQRRLLETEVVAKALNEDPLEYHFCPIAILPILELADYKPPGAPPGNPATGLKVLQNLPGDVSLVLVEAHLDGVSVLQLLTDLEQLSERPMLLTDKAKSELVGRLTNVSTPAMPVSLLLDQVLETLRLTWIQSEDGITVMHRNELSDRDAASYELARTQRMIGQVQLLFGNGHRTHRGTDE